MMTLIYVLAGFLVLIIILAAIAPKTYNVHRGITIDKPKEIVFDYMRYLKNYEDWSPWHKKNPAIKITYTGTDGQEGSKSSWEGNKEVGSGSQTIIRIEDNKLIESRILFLKPWKSESIGYYHFDDAAPGQTKLTWGFNGTNKFPATIFMLVYNMDKVVGKDFTDGLKSFKKILEEV